MNRNHFEDQRHALTRVDHAIRGQLLGRALHAVRYNPDFCFDFFRRMSQLLLDLTSFSHKQCTSLQLQRIVSI
jgi:hypothetical protein